MTFLKFFDFFLYCCHFDQFNASLLKIIISFFKKNLSKPNLFSNLYAHTIIYKYMLHIIIHI